jgi:hypothetical protein
MIHFMRFRRAVTAVMALGIGVLGVPMATAMPALAAVSCSDIDPRNVNPRSGDSDGDGVAGGVAAAAVYVDRTGNGIYHVCVEGTLYDTDADTWGAAVWAEYEQWNGSRWVPEQHMLKRADGYGAVEPFTDDTYMVRNYYLRVCLIQSGQGGRNHCGARA